MPHIGIIDPRTGESLRQLFGFKSAVELASLRNFLFFRSHL